MIGEGTMGKNKPRHNHDKRQNKMGDFCQYYEEYASGGCYCEGGSFRVQKCVRAIHIIALKQCIDELRAGAISRLIMAISKECNMWRLYNC